MTARKIKSVYGHVESVRVKESGFYRVVPRQKSSGRVTWNYKNQKGIPGIIIDDVFVPYDTQDRSIIKKYVPERVCYPLRKTYDDKQTLMNKNRKLWADIFKRLNITNIP